MALCGGSDDEFFRRFARSRHSIVWADGARVREWVPPSRATLSWLLRRQFRVGTATALVERRLWRPRQPAARHLAHGLWCVAKGVVLALRALPRGRGAAARELRLAAFGAGRLAGLAGVVYREYEGAVHGR
jgi:succinoglycan biosynthesis protein ExoM